MKPVMKDQEIGEKGGGQSEDMAEGEGSQPHGALTTKARNKLPDSDFALPGRKYPIENLSHARNALSRVSQFGSPSEKKAVRAAVYRRYPELKPTFNDKMVVR